MGKFNINRLENCDWICSGSVDTIIEIIDYAYDNLDSILRIDYNNHVFV